MKIILYGCPKLKEGREPLYSSDFFQFYFKKTGHKVKWIGKTDLKGLLKIKDINNYDVMIVTRVFSFIPILLKKMNLIKIPIIHYWADDYFSSGGFGGSYLRGKGENWIVKNADYNFTVSKYREKKAKKLGVEEVKFFPHGVINEFDKIESSKDLKEKIKVVYGGKINKKKGIDKIIKIAKSNKNVKFYLFGEIESNMEDYLKNKPENVCIKGHVPHKNLISYYKAADILILATNNDSTLKMYEYIKAKKPILSLNNRVGHVLKHKETAYLTDDLGKGLRELIRDEKLRKMLSNNLNIFDIPNWEELCKIYIRYLNEIGKNARETAINYGWDSIVKKQINEIKNVHGKK